MVDLRPQIPRGSAGIPRSLVLPVARPRFTGGGLDRPRKGQTTHQPQGAFWRNERKTAPQNENFTNHKGFLLRWFGRSLVLAECEFCVARPFRGPTWPSDPLVNPEDKRKGFCQWTFATVPSIGHDVGETPETLGGLFPPKKTRRQILSPRRRRNASGIWDSMSTQTWSHRFRASGAVKTAQSSGSEPR